MTSFPLDKAFWTTRAASIAWFSTAHPAGPCAVCRADTFTPWPDQLAAARAAKRPAVCTDCIRDALKSQDTQRRSVAT